MMLTKNADEAHYLFRPSTATLIQILRENFTSELETYDLRRKTASMHDAKDLVSHS